MHQKNKDIQKRYEGFLQTNCLWKNDVVYNLHQFKIDVKSTKIAIEIDEKLRLGKYIERFVSYQLQQDNSIKILCENIQIQKEKITLGELDCIIKKNEKPIHLEVIYKFYLYDDTVGFSEIEHFIGPNRKDSLIEKLKKLHDKQLPLLYSTECVNYLKTIHLKADKIAQQVYFKGQLFMPLSKINKKLEILNSDAITGFYINQKEINLFKNDRFFIPKKKDWIIQPHQNVNWLNFDDFKNETNQYLERKFSPLCWIKLNNGEIKKIFFVWWT
ncbi:DUF1853 family protein [Polaribacter sargassicola]|uniref:DUF1853 family protein n=1 Tax=Polaribacter sargassicola TaxID=2836891 RepID=UPI001F4321CE|nr:DUF1853 family protein [Polaribacter sp. DS7-9]MCG1036722.1 DUF1853 family protein [Polaribacter sp. DS7-9]